MQKVNHYLRQAKAARKLAAHAGSEKARSHFIEIAEKWETLASERLELLQMTEDGDALVIVTHTPNKADADGTPTP